MSYWSKRSPGDWECKNCVEWLGVDLHRLRYCITPYFSLLQWCHDWCCCSNHSYHWQGQENFHEVEGAHCGVGALESPCFDWTDSRGCQTFHPPHVGHNQEQKHSCCCSPHNVDCSCNQHANHEECCMRGHSCSFRIHYCQVRYFDSME